MTKVIFTYLISFWCALIFTGIGQLYANTNSNHAYQLSIKKGADQSLPVIDPSQKNEVFYFNSVSPNTESQNYIINIPFFETAEEEDESGSHKKHSKNDYSSTFQHQVVAHLYNYISIPTFSNYFSCNASYKYLMFGAFRL